MADPTADGRKAGDGGEEDGFRKFAFDGSLGPKTTQREAYDVVASAAITKVCLGINATVFAYGQTGSGKTHTMLGDAEKETTLGLIPRALNELFGYVEQRKKEVKCKVTVSVLEIYNERLRDLAGGPGEDPPVRDRPRMDLYEERGTGRVRVTNLTQIEVSASEETMDILSHAIESRVVAATDANATSSRSHLVFTLTLEQVDVGDEEVGATRKVSALNLVDLAGSERQSKTGAAGARLREGANINQSLSCLGKVIIALVKGKDFVPYRESKLTRLLQSSLGGNAYTVMLACVSSADEHAKESLTTLRFADSAKKIVNKTSVNEDPALRKLRELMARVKELEAENVHLRAKVIAGSGSVIAGSGSTSSACCVVS